MKVHRPARLRAPPQSHATTPILRIAKTNNVVRVLGPHLANRKIAMPKTAAPRIAVGVAVHVQCDGKIEFTTF